MKIIRLIALALIVLSSCKNSTTEEAKQLFETTWDIRDKELQITNYKKIMELAPESPYGLYGKAWFLEESHNSQGSLAISKEILSQNPTFWQGWLHSAKCKFSLGDLKGAIQDYDEVIRLNSSYIDAYNMRGFLKDEVGDAEGAMQDYNQVILLNPKDAQAYNNRGNLKSKLRDRQGAIQDYSQAILINPQDTTAYYMRGLQKLLIEENGCADLIKAGELGKDVSEVIKRYYCQ